MVTILASYNCVFHLLAPLLCWLLSSREINITVQGSRTAFIVLPTHWDAPYVRRKGHPNAWVRLCAMQAILEPCTVRLTSLEGSNQHSSGAIVGRQDGYHAERLTQTWGTCFDGVDLGSRLRARVGDTTYY